MTTDTNPLPSRPSGASALGRWMSRNPSGLALLATLAAFGAYSCMYAFRKPFTAATYSELRFWGFDYKILLVLAQTIGYTLSKFIGIKVVAEVRPSNRAWIILGLIGFSEGALLLFPLVPTPWNVVCLFFNGLPLGMIWGIIFGFLEGRKVSDLLGLGLSISFIVSSDIMKSAGRTIMDQWHISEFWMPAVTGGLFAPVLLICLWVLMQVPAPTAEDEVARTKRVPMGACERWKFVREYGLGLGLLIFAYVILTVYRDLRDTFMVEILKDLNALPDNLVFTRVGLSVGLAVLVVLSFFWRIHDNRRAVFTYLTIIGIGAFVVGASTLAFHGGLISPFWWMVWTGVGSYLAYVPYNSVLFERLLATFKNPGNSGFLITLADSFGYLSSSGLYIYRAVFKGTASWLSFLNYCSYLLALSVPLLLLASALYFRRRSR